MALVLADRVLETTTVAGTGDASLDGAVTGYQPFSVIGTGNTTYYTIVAIDDNGAPTGDWEVGIGTYTLSGNTISRDTVLSSSNGGALVYFASGTKQIFLDLPSEELITTASTGISISGNTITNTAPDQVVSLTGAGTTTITGTYPSFTITSTGGSGGGDVTGPASSTDNALARFDGTTGKLIQNSVATLTDAGILSTDKELVGSNANFTDFPNAQAVFSQANTGSGHIYNMGIAGEGVATDVVGGGQWGVGVYGTGATAGATRGIGVVGDGHVGNTADTAAAIGVRGYATNTHSGGQNIGLYSQATGGASNYALFMASGNIYSAVTQTWAVQDNEASALSIDATGKAGILKIVTTDGAEKVTMSGGLNVTGTTTLATSLSGLAKLTSGVVSAATSGTDYAPATSGTSILYGNGSGGFSNVTIGTGVSFAGGTLSATGSGGTVTSVAATAGTGISVTGSPITSSGTLTITNTAPDQTVAITGAGGAVVTGTYPNFTITTPSGTVTSVSGTAPIASTGGATPAISISQATTSTDGYLSSTDWNTFNGKGSGTVTSVGGTGTVNGITLTGTVTSSGNLTLGGTLGGIGNSQLTNSAITINGTSTSLGGSISVGTVTSVTGTAPVVSSGGATPAISMAAATTSVNGYLTSTDWNTFNGKYSTGGALGTPSSGTLTNCTGYTYANLSGTVPTWNQDTTGKSAKTDALNSATTTINVSSATAPSAGQALIATSSTAATWQTIAASQWTTSGSNIYYTTGKVGIGTSSPSYTFDVTGSAANAYIGFHQNTAGTADDNMYLFRMGASANSANATFLYCQTSTTQRFTIKGNGGIANYQANDTNLSDERVKKDIVDAGNYLDRICSIPVKTFLYKDQSDTFLNLGVIAQDVEAVAPELVDASGFGETPDDGVPLKSIYQTDLQYALMKSIQELKAIVDAQAARITELEAK
jgi:hypothetical protein